MTLVDWVEDNQDSLSQSIVNSHLATELSHNISAILGRYLNVCVRASCMDGLEAPGSNMECSLNHMTFDLLCGPSQGVTHLPPSLKALLARRNSQCVGRGLGTPGVSEARRLYNIK